MAHRLQEPGDDARVRRDAEPGLIVGAEDIVENVVSADVLSVARLAQLSVPQLVVLGEARLELVPGEHVADVRLVRAPVAGVHRHALAEALLDGGDKGVLLRERNIAKGEVGSDGAADQGAGVVGLKVGHLLRLVAVFEVSVGLDGLGYTSGGHERISPDGGAVAVLFGPIALQVELVKLEYLVISII